ncbi:hypothetical protein [Clostridium sp. KNHs214]|uniref:hypothetical protein n=1 Tax=Clostridium sp. KNHs214 TaxID=1540257 RepID=UPI0005563D88|nr:hypothetical protein [Clostridium sp. KNHs214]
MNSNKFSDLIKSILYILIFLMILALTIKLAIGIFKIGAIILLAWLAYRGIMNLVSYFKNKKKDLEHKKKGYTVNDDGIVDVDYEDVEK